MRRYKYTITLAVLVVLVVALLLGRWHESRECQARGGVYVQTLTGWACVR